MIFVAAVYAVARRAKLENVVAACSDFCGKKSRGKAFVRCKIKLCSCACKRFFCLLAYLACKFFGNLCYNVVVFVKRDKFFTDDANRARAVIGFIDSINALDNLCYKELCEFTLCRRKRRRKIILSTRLPP